MTGKAGISAARTQLGWELLDKLKIHLRGGAQIVRRSKTPDLM